MEIRDQLRRDHEMALAELEALCAEPDDPRSHARLRQLRRTWVIHALAEEAVVYRALESAESGHADERFTEHERVEARFEKLARSRSGSLEWHERLSSVRELILRHIAAEEDATFGELGGRFDAAARDEMGQRFELTRDKLTLLEEAKGRLDRGARGERADVRSHGQRAESAPSPR